MAAAYVRTLHTGAGQAARLDVLDVAEEQENERVEAQIREVLRRNAARVIKLFRQWDEARAAPVHAPSTR